MKWYDQFTKYQENPNALLENCDINSLDEESNPPLWASIKNNFHSIASILLLNIKDIDRKNEEGSTPLMLASEIGLIKMVETILQFGANSLLKDKKGKSALFYALDNGSLSCFNYLCSKIENIDHQDELGRSLLINLAMKPAIYKRFINNIDFFKDNDFPLMQKKWGLPQTSVPPRLKLYDHNKIVFYLSICQLLKNCNLNFDHQDLFGKTAIHYATLSSNKELTEILLYLNVDPNIQDYTGQTALHKCVDKKDPDMSKILIQYDANPTLEDEKGNKPQDLLEEGMGEIEDYGITDEVMEKYQTDDYLQDPDLPEQTNINTPSVDQYDTNLKGERLLSEKDRQNADEIADFIKVSGSQDGTPEEFGLQKGVFFDAQDNSILDDIEKIKNLKDDFFSDDTLSGDDKIQKIKHLQSKVKEVNEKLKVKAAKKQSADSESGGLGKQLDELYDPDESLKNLEGTLSDIDANIDDMIENDMFQDSLKLQKSIGNISEEIDRSLVKLDRKKQLSQLIEEKVKDEKKEKNVNKDTLKEMASQLDDFEFEGDDEFFEDELKDRIEDIKGLRDRQLEDEREMQNAEDSLDPGKALHDIHFDGTQRSHIEEPKEPENIVVKGNIQAQSFDFGMNEPEEQKERFEEGDSRATLDGLDVDFDDDENLTSSQVDDDNDESVDLDDDDEGASRVDDELNDDLDDDDEGMDLDDDEQEALVDAELENEMEDDITDMDLDEDNFLDPEDFLEPEEPLVPKKKKIKEPNIDDDLYGIKKRKKLAEKRRKEQESKKDNEESFYQKKKKQKMIKYKAFDRDSKGVTPIINACQNGDIKEINRLIKLGASFNSRDFNGRTCLMHAAASGNMKVVRLILSKYKNVNEKDRQGQTAIYFAMLKHHFGICDLLIKMGGKLNIRLKGIDPLMYASSIGDLTLIKYLMQRGMNPNTKDYRGRNSLHYAISSKRAEAVKFLSRFVRVTPVQGKKRR